MTVLVDAPAYPIASFTAYDHRAAAALARDYSAAERAAKAAVHNADLDAALAVGDTRTAGLIVHCLAWYRSAELILAQPEQGPQVGVECRECNQVGAWATVRVYDDLDSEDPLDAEVCSSCASRLLDRAPEWLRSEPLCPEDYKRHGIPVADPEPTEWDTATAPTYPATVLGDDALVFGGAA